MRPERATREESGGAREGEEGNEGCKRDREREIRGIELGLSHGSGRLFYRQEGNDQNTPGGAPK